MSTISAQRPRNPLRANAVISSVLITLLLLSAVTSLLSGCTDNIPQQPRIEFAPIIDVNFGPTTHGSGGPYPVFGAPVATEADITSADPRTIAGLTHIDMALTEDAWLRILQATPCNAWPGTSLSRCAVGVIVDGHVVGVAEVEKSAGVSPLRVVMNEPSEAEAVAETVLDVLR